jgi:hypothetical protein
LVPELGLVSFLHSCILLLFLSTYLSSNSSNMLPTLLFVLVFQSLPVSGQVYFNTQISTVTAITAPVITTTQVASAFTALLAPSAAGSQPSSTATGSEPTNTSNSTGTGIASLGASSSQSAKMVEMLIIAGITLAAVIILFWIWMKYGRRPYVGCEHQGCKCSKMKKMWHSMSRPILYGKLERDTEKGRLVTVWRGQSESEESSELDSSRETLELSGREREAEVRGDGNRRTIVQERSEAGDRRSRRTILAELEGDSVEADPMPEEIPAPDFERQMKWPVPVPALAKIAVIGGKCEVVRGKDAAVIVAVGKRLRSDSAATATIRLSGDLPHIPPEDTHDCCEDFLRTKRQVQVEDAIRIREMRKDIYVMRKEESSKQGIGQEIGSCASPVGNFVSISS